MKSCYQHTVILFVSQSPLLIFWGACVIINQQNIFIKLIVTFDASFCTVQALLPSFRKVELPSSTAVSSPSRCPSPRQLFYRWAFLAKVQRLTQGEGEKSFLQLWKSPPHRVDFHEYRETKFGTLSDFALRTELWALSNFP